MFSSLGKHFLTHWYTGYQKTFHDFMTFLSNWNDVVSNVSNHQGEFMPVLESTNTMILCSQTFFIAECA